MHSYTLSFLKRSPSIFSPKLLSKRQLAAALIISASLTQYTYSSANNGPESNSALLEEIIVTARKRDESILDVPLAISAFNSEQLDSLKVRDLQTLSVTLPNVAFDDLGTQRGTANFSIRGLGINSSIASVDPTVGTFVDGVYLGTNQGVVLDVFDLQSIEVLRGPQGTLFGRNVTGGAVLLNSQLPSEDFQTRVKTAIEGGGERANVYLMASAGGAVNDTLAAKLSVYTNQDGGYFKNLANNQAFGEQNTVSARPMLVWTPSDKFKANLIYDYFKTDGDGPANQSHRNGRGFANPIANFDRDSFDFALDEPGFVEIRSDFVRSRADLELANGRLTNIFGYRRLNQKALIDVDGSSLNVFTSPTELDSEQISNELRYDGNIGDRLKVTAGAYYFNNQLAYSESRGLLGLLAAPGQFALTQSGGGNHEVTTMGVFASLDYSFSDKLSLNAGVRFTDEEKSVEIASLSRNVNAPCDVIQNTCPLDFRDSDNWSNTSPKIGLSYQINQTTLSYAHWARGVRSGGYNLRNTAADTVNFGPGPFNEETADSIEIGIKTQFANKLRLSAAVFETRIDDLQREVSLSDANSGIVQLIRNTADAKITGLEFDGVLPLSDSLLITASLGYLDPQYTQARFDINGDGAVDSADRDLKLPRAARLSYSFGLNLQTSLGDWASATSRVSYSYRDRSAYTDNNLGFINEQGIVDAGVDFVSSDQRWSLGVYVKNLTNEVKHGGDTQLPSLLGPVELGGTFAPLAKGRVYGLELGYTF